MESFPIGSMALALLSAAAILVWRVHESRRPVTVRRLVIPPLGMSTGFSMFAVHAFRIPWMWGVASFALGAAVFAQPIIATSRLTREGDVIMMRRSPWFVAIILVLAALRLALRDYVGTLISPQQTAGIFFVLAFGMIVRWRSSLFLQYRLLTSGQR